MQPLSHHRHDVVVVGAGIVGLAHAAAAVGRGASVAVIERDDRAVGASVRNFGHICTTAQSGVALERAVVARERWIDLGRKADFDVNHCGTTILARTTDELGVLEEFADARGAKQVRLLGPSERADLPVAGAGLVGAAHLPQDLRVDPTGAVAALARWLGAEGVEFHWGTTVGSIETHGDEVVVHTSRGVVRGGAAVHAVGHDVDRLYPAIADEWQVERCRLQMLEVAAPDGVVIAPAILTGLSMLRYGGLAEMPSAQSVRHRFAEQSPELLDVAMNLMLTQRPSGAIVLGDTHHHARTHDPFDDEHNAELLLREGVRLLGHPLRVLRRWRGLYATSPHTDFLIAPASPLVRVVSVTSGIGMTTALGLAPAVIDELL